jgi:exosortase
LGYQTQPRADDPARATGDGAREPVFLGLTLGAWLMIGTVAVLMAITYWPNLRRLYLKVNPFTGEPNWSHSVVIPIIGLYFLYLNRDDLFRARLAPVYPNQITRNRLLGAAALFVIGLCAYFVGPMLAPNMTGYARAFGQGMVFWGVLVLLLNWGLATLLFGLLMSAFGIYPGRNDFIWDFGMVVALFGAVLMICGWQVMRIAWFPIVYLVCAIPWPGLVYSKVAGPLQQLAAKVAVGTLQLTGVDAARSGTKIFIGNGLTAPVRTLNVAEACAGMRSLMTFISVGAAVAFLSGRPLWQKVVITLSAIPIAIFCNVMRVAGQGILDHYVSQQLSESFAHQFVGMVMLIPAFFLILLVGWVLDQIFIEEVEAAPVVAKKAAATSSGGDQVIRVTRRPAGATGAPGAQAPQTTEVAK